AQPQPGPSDALPVGRAVGDVRPADRHRLPPRCDRADLPGHRALPAGRRPGRAVADAHRRRRRGDGRRAAARARRRRRQALRHARPAGSAAAARLMTAIAPLAVVVPVLAACVLIAGGRHVPRALADVTALGAAAATTVLCALLLGHVWNGGELVVWFGGWHPRPHGIAVGIDLAVDPLG